MNKFSENVILNCDSYKTSHFMFLEEGTTYSQSYIESRKGAEDNEVLFFGLQYILLTEFMKPVTMDMIDEAEKFLTAHGEPFNRVGWEYIVKEHNGFLPIRIKAVKEGVVVPTNNALIVVESTDPHINAVWVASYIETELMRIWYPITVATKSRKFKKVISKYLEATGDPSLIDHKLVDFGARGVSTKEQAMMGGAAHLVNFRSTDNIMGIAMAMEYYAEENGKTDMIAESIPATEHSVTTSWGKLREKEFFENIVRNVLPKTGICSVVSDTYNLMAAIEMFGELRSEIEKNGVIVVRPDCYSDDTSIYTDRGWVLFNDLNEYDKVAQVLDDGTYEFIKPLNIIKHNYNGDMYHFKDFHGKVDLLVTPEHRMVLEQSGKERIIFAKDMRQYGNHFQKMIRTARCKSSDRRLTDKERLNIAFQADGSYVTNSNKKIRFSFSKQRKIKRMNEILSRMNYDYTQYDLKDGRTELHINVKNSDDFNKDFSWVKINTLNNEWCVDFIEELSYWDSCRRSNTRYKFDTTNKKAIDVVEHIAISAGYGVLLSEYDDTRKKCFNHIFTAHILLNNKVGGQSWSKTKTNYNGFVYCVKVPSGKIMVKRNRCTMVCGNSGEPISTTLEVVKKLDDLFGHKVNNKGYKVLNDCVRIIQGDGIDVETTRDILESYMNNGYSADNITFGSGGALLQKVNRDTNRFAMKACHVIVDGEGRDIQKVPLTDPTKASKAGRLKLVKDIITGEFRTINQHDYIGANEVNMMDTVYKNGILMRYQSFNEIREIARNYF